MPLSVPAPPLTTSSEEQILVERALGGDASAFGELAERFWPQLVRLARVALAGAPEAEDVAQEALMTAWRDRSALRRAGSFAPWLRRITWRRALKAARRRPEIPLEPVLQRVSGETGSAEARMDVERLLRRLTPRERAVVYLSEVEGRTAAEIAAELGIAAATARVHRWQARRRLAALHEEAR